MDTSSESLVNIQGLLSSLDCRIVPTSFDAEDLNLMGFPLSSDWRWHSCEKALFIFKPHGVMMRIPLFWQLEVPLWYAARSVQAPIHINEPENMPLAIAALKRGGMDTVVTERRDATTFVDFLILEGEPLPRAWVIVHRITDTWSIPSEISDCSIAQEVHLFPGVPILYQCKALMRERAASPRFHAAEGCTLTIDTSEVTLPPHPGIPSLRLPIPTLTLAGDCPCGNVTYKKKV